MSRLTPMLASVGSELPRDEGWVFEPKYDGIRVLAFVEKGDVALVSRNGLDKTKQFPEVVDALRSLHSKVKRPFVLDGEIVVMRGDAPARFQELQSRMHVTNAAAIEAHRKDTPTAFIAFDILLDGKATIVNEPWRVRRQHLTALLKAAGRATALRLTDVADDGAKMLREAEKRGWEGVIAKRDDAPYVPGHRSRDWKKLKIERRQEFVVGGWTEPRNSREHIGALLLGYYTDDGALVYAGHTGTGFTRAGLADMYRRLKPLERSASPFSTTPKTNQLAHWAKPEVVAEIRFNEWTTDGKLRQPVFLGVRDDKDPHDVVHEPESMAGRARAKPAKGAAASSKAKRPKTKSRSLPSVGTTTVRAKMTARKAAAVVAQLRELEQDDEGTLELPDGEIEVSSLTKVFYPKTKTTKGDLMRYYARMSPYLLPAIEDRALVMKRFPNGVKGQAFYQQKAPDKAPPGVRIEEVSDEGLTTARRIVGGNLATLLYVVQLGAISIDPWHSRVESIQFADYAIIDLDPGPRAPFTRVVEVAREVKDVLDDLNLHAVLKTSGASGIHIVLPLPPRVPNDGARIIAELVATRVAARVPRIATIERQVKARPSDAVYVDFLQNIRGKTVAGVYSARAQDRPTVSTPLAWDELESDLDPQDFTIDDVPARVERVGDLWAKGMKKPNSLGGILGRG